MMYSSPGQPLPGGYGTAPPTGPYGAPPTGPYGAPPTGSYGAPPPGAQYRAPPPPGPQPGGYQAPPPPTDRMAGMSLGGGRAPPPPGGSSQFQPPPPTGGQMFRPPPPTSYQGGPPGSNFPPPPGPSNVPQHPPQPHPAPPPSGLGGPPPSGQAPTNYGQPPGSGQPPPVSGQPPMGYRPPPPTSLGQPPNSQPGGYGQAPPMSHAQPSGHPQPPGMFGPPPPPPTSGQAPPVSHAQPSGHPQPPRMFGQPPPPPTSGQAPPMSHAQPSGHPQPPGMFGPPPPPSTSGQAPPMSHAQPSGHPQPPGMFAPPPPSGQAIPPQPGIPGAPPSSGQAPIMRPPMPGTMMHTGPPPSGPPFMSGGPPPQTHGVPPMGPPPGSPGGLMGPPPGGMVQQPPRTRIDPEQMPNPVAMMQLDQEQRGSAPYHTSSRGIPPPLVTTNFTVVDDGISSPRFIRATLYNVPVTKDLLNSCRIPLGLVVQPMATIPDQENSIHVVDHGAGGPLRCNRCKTYMNPFVRFVDGGRQYICPICQCSNEVPPEYFCHLDHKGMRTDLMSRPELIYGTVEYRATLDYCKDSRMPKAPAYIFLIDVSAASVSSGLLPLLSQNILTVLDHLPDSSQDEGSPILVGVATYDKVLHFYNMKPSLAQPGMMVVTDTADMFVPMVDGFLVNVKEARGVMESLLTQLPGMFSGVRPSDVLLEPAVRAGLEALKAAGRNGRLFLFHTSLPSAQTPGQLKNRLDSKLLGTDKEKTLLQSGSSSYKKLAEECVKYGVAVELFLTPPTYCDVATLGGLCSTTGGQLHLFPNYQTAADGSRLVSELIHCVARPTGFDAVMRVRASTGLRPTGFYGSFFMQNTTDIELGNIDADKAIAVEIKHDDKLKEDETPFFQAALLYTTYRGERRLRIHNIALNCTSKFQDLYRSSEIDTIINFLSKSVVQASLSMPFKAIRENLTKQCAIMLACYRKQCSSQSPAGQLILPESLKLLPMYTNCILKSDCLLSPPILSLDEKCWLMYSVLSMSLEQSGAFFYPRMISLHDVDVEGKGLPPVLRCTGQKLQETGVYAIENGFQLVVWVGQQVSHDFTSQVFGAPSVAQVNTDMASLPALDNALSFRVRGICAHLQAARQLQMKVRVVVQRDKTEVLFRRMLKEDKGAGQWEGTNYVDFLCQIHRDIKELLN